MTYTKKLILDTIQATLTNTGLIINKNININLKTYIYIYIYGKIVEQLKGWGNFVLEKARYCVEDGNEAE